MTAALQRLEGDRLHDRLDDAVARRRLHPRPVHGRHRRPAAARVRGDDRRRDSDFRLRLAELTPMLAAPVPASRRARSATAGCTWRSSGCSTAALRRLRLDAAARRCATTRVTMAVVGAAPRRDRLLLPDHPEGLHPEPGHRPDQRPDRDGAGPRLRGDGRRISSRSCGSSSADPNVKSVTSSIGGGGGLAAARRTAAACQHRAEAARANATLTADQVIDGAAAEARRRCRACACS